MLRPDHIARRARLLGLAIIGLQITGAAAIAETGRDGVAAVVPSPDVVLAQAADPATVAVPPTAPATTAAPAPAPSTTAAPATTAPPPAPKPAPAAPAPTPAPAPAPPPPPPPPADPHARILAAYEASVPAAWRAAIPARFEVIEGGTSWAFHNGTIQIGSTIANGKESVLRVTVAHEFGHLVAFGYGSQAFNGAAPEGWPAYSNRPEEAWADCVSRALTGINDASHGLPDCAGSSLSWTAGWMGSGPDSHPRTR
jgi:hypothetical protein